MADLLGGIGLGQVRETPLPVVLLKAGVVQTRVSDGALVVNVDGANPPAIWPAGYIPTAGDAVRVLIVDGSALVTGPVIVGQRPGEGTVAGAAALGTIPITTTAGTVRARYTGTAPAVGTLVFLDWQATTARLMAGTAAAPPPVIPPPDVP